MYVIKRATWYIDEDLLYKMKRIALDNRTTLTEIANQAFIDYVNKHASNDKSVLEKDVKTLAKDHAKIEKDRRSKK